MKLINDLQEIYYMDNPKITILLSAILIIFAFIFLAVVKNIITKERFDDLIFVKSKKAIDSYDVFKYIKEDNTRIDYVIKTIKEKEKHKKNANYIILIKYISPRGKKTAVKKIEITKNEIIKYKKNPSLWMDKTKYNKLIKEKNEKILNKKRHDYYEKVNNIIDIANKSKNDFIILNDKNEIDRIIADLFDRTINSINKIKDINSDEWTVINNIINIANSDINTIIHKNEQISNYYESEEFTKIKETVSSLMQSQKEFNKYIDEKAESISKLFGQRLVRNETIVDDKYNYIRPYKKEITPFTAEVSAQVFASAENNPMEYIIKYFYPNKDKYPEQIEQLHTLIEELQTLQEARDIIECSKKEYEQYIENVPEFILENDKIGFYKRLGFADISKEALIIEYKFSHTSNGGFSQRSFSVPMTEETIIKLIDMLQNKLTTTAFTKEQRALMTPKLRLQIKERDNYTCQFCNNSIHKEPNLLLEIDHIIPVTKGGYTVPENLQTLCWKCNRNKSNKIL